jgi:hypothetical protein
VTDGSLVVFAALATIDLLIGALQFGAKRGELAGLPLTELSPIRNCFTAVSMNSLALSKRPARTFDHDSFNISIQVDLHNQFPRLIVDEWRG